MTENDLAPHARRQLQQAYDARERPKCSREDFVSGYIAALIDLRSRSSFLDGRWMPDERVPWEEPPA